MYGSEIQSNGLDLSYGFCLHFKEILLTMLFIILAFQHAYSSNWLLTLEDSQLDINTEVIKVCDP